MSKENFRQIPTRCTRTTHTGMHLARSSDHRALESVQAVCGGCEYRSFAPTNLGVALQQHVLKDAIYQVIYLGQPLVRRRRSVAHLRIGTET